MQFLNNLSKTIRSQKTADIILIDADIIIFLQQVKVKKKKSKKLTKIVKIEEVKIQIFGETSMRFLGKM